jgi:hypothetical protein
MSTITKSEQGQSAFATEIKQRGLMAAFAINLAIFQRQYGNNPRARYLHVDLNAGSGFNDKVGCIGSPLAFLAAAHAKEVSRFTAVFCDQNEDHVRTLMARPEVASEERAFVVLGDNAAYCAAVPHVAEAIGERREYVIGSVLCDPNGTEVPTDELAVLADQCPRMDVMLNVAATALKRNKHLGVRIEDIVKAIPKRHWLIREPVGDWQWTMLIGRNIEVGQHRSLGFHHLDSRKGIELLDHVSRTAAERAEAGHPGQGGLF